MKVARDYTRIPVAAVIPVYNERAEALAATLDACVRQTYPVAKVVVVDDGSADPVVLPDWAKSLPEIDLIRLSSNQGISAARNTAIASCNTPLVACINTEVVPKLDWLATCERYLSSHPSVGACYTPIVPEDPRRVLSQWRMRFLEAKCEKYSGPSIFAPGHAVLFRREAINSVGGYDTRLRRIMEDSDICERMRNAGWETHYVAESGCISTQKDSLANLCTKQLVRGGWTSPADYPLRGLIGVQCRALLMRVGRNLAKGRFLFLPIDFAIWGGSLWIAIPRYLRRRRSRP